MMHDKRLIDANALPMYKVKIVHAFGIVEGSVVFPDDISKAPTIDAVEVVRCTDCVNSQKLKRCADQVHCMVWKNNPRTDGYCYLGVKMDGGATDD